MAEVITIVEQSPGRIIIECRGVEIDIHADEEGITIEAQTPEEGVGNLYIDFEEIESEEEI